MNSKGPRIDPCGTPLSTTHQLELLSPIIYLRNNKQKQPSNLLLNISSSRHLIIAAEHLSHRSNSRLRTNIFIKWITRLVPL